MVAFSGLEDTLWDQLTKVAEIASATPCAHTFATSMS